MNTYYEMIAGPATGHFSASYFLNLSFNKTTNQILMPYPYLPKPKNIKTINFFLPAIIFGRTKMNNITGMTRVSWAGWIT